MEFWSSIWNVITVFFWAFVFIASIYALVAIATDLFRDRNLPGWGKAIWLVCLVFLPLLTVLVYLIARGDGMARRAAKEGEQARQAAEDYIRSVAAPTPAADIAQAKQLLDAGTITADEFAQLKQRALQG